MEVWQIIVLLGACVLMYAFLLPKQKQAPQHDIVQQLEETMEYYAAEMEEENQKLVGHISTMKNDHDHKMSQLLNQIKSLEQQNHQLEERIDKLSGLQRHKSGSLLALSSVPVYETTSHEALPLSDAQSEPLSDLKARYAELFQLYDDGKSLEQIAKKLAMNKGEVQLILQLARQGEQESV